MDFRTSPSSIILIVFARHVGYYGAPFKKSGARLGNGERERRTGTRLLDMLLQHIYSEVNTTKGVGLGDVSS
jgi:hypothetical protein